MMMAFVLVTTFWIGAVLMLAELRWFRRRSLDRRLKPYVPGTVNDGPLASGSLQSARTLIPSLAQSIGGRVALAFGVSEDLAIRLDRIHSPVDVSGFRMRETGWAFASFGLATLVVLGVDPPAWLVPLFLFGLPVLAFLLVEQSLARASSGWQRRVFLELPVVSEQLGMLLSAGYSVGSALNRVASRGHGACATDLGRVCNRIRHGVGENDALSEWSEVSGVPAVGRVVAVLALDRDAADLGRLITEEARAVRREVHRQLIETIERRSQQVWIPVTVATLLPGMVFIAVPFFSAMELFTAG
jgi:Flp pilus assembly protein TadB